MEQLLQLDSDLFLYLNSLGTDTWDGFWMFITGKWNAIPLYGVLLVLIYKKIGFKPTLYTLIVVGAMIVLTDQITKYFKFTLLLRERPCYELESQVRLVKDWCGSRGGYFSAHASNAMALAVFIGIVLKPYFKYIQLVLFLWAFMVGYSRIYIGVHYPGDVITGFIFGGLLALLAFRIQQKLLLKYTTK